MPLTTRALLLTDVVDSTKLSEALGDERMAQAWVAHDRVARDLLVPHRGRESDGLGPRPEWCVAFLHGLNAGE